MHLINTLAFLQSTASHIDARKETGKGKEKICELAYESRYPDVAIVIAQAIEGRYWTASPLTSKQAHKLAEIVIDEGAPSQARRFILAINGHLNSGDFKSLVELMAEDESGVQARTLLEEADFRIPSACRCVLKIIGMRYRPHE